MPATGDRIGDHRQTKGTEARAVAIGIENQRAHLRGQAGYDAFEQALPGKAQERLVLALHAQRPPAGENAGDRQLGAGQALNRIYNHDGMCFTRFLATQGVSQSA